MSSIDERVVEMRFDNRAFASGAKSTLDDLDNLKKGLKLEGATKGLEDINSAAKNTQLSHIGAAVDGIAQKFSAMSVIGLTALTNLANKAVNAGMQMAKSLTIEPLTSGFSEYELTIGSIQTMLANTSRYGTKLPEVTANLNELNAYADKTIYNFGDMTKNIGLFTNAGIRIGDATQMIKGFSNVAAASGTSAEGAAGAAYQLSQALSSGTIRLMDWRSLTNVGMGNKNMQEGIIQIADAMGTFSGTGVDATEAGAHFNETLEKGWLSADVMSNYLKIMAGEMDVTKMKALGLSDAQIVAFQKQQKIAEDSATKVRTFTQLLGTLREAVGSAWSETFRNVFGDFNEATDLFTGLNNSLGGLITSSGTARNKMLADWKALGGRAQLIKGLQEAWLALSRTLGPIGKAFRDIFPRSTGQQVYNMTVAFRDFMHSLVPTKETADKLRKVFGGLFAILNIGWMFIKAGIHFLADLIGHFTKGTGGILDFAAGIGDWLKSVNWAIQNGNLFGKMFDKLAGWIEAPIDFLKNFVGEIGDFVKAIVSSKAAQQVIERWRKNFDQMQETGDAVGGAWERVKKVFSAIWDAIQPVVRKIGDIFKEIGGAVADFMGNLSFGDILAGGSLAVGAVMIVKIKNAIVGLIDRIKGGGGGPGVFDRIKEALEGLTGTFKQMQNTLKAAQLLAIAAAIGVMTIAVSVLSKIDAGALYIAVGAIGVMVTELVATMIVLNRAMGRAKAVKLAILAAGMILLAAAIDILASAAKKLSSMDWNELAKGLTGTIALLAAVAGAMRIMPTQRRMISTGLGIIAVATAINILVNAVKSLSQMSWAELAEGFTGTAALLTAMALFTRFSGPSSIGSGAGIVLIASALKILASAMHDIAELDWNELSKGMTGIAVGLGTIAGALRLMSRRNLLNAAAVVVVAAGMKVLASALRDISKLDWESIGKGLTGVAVGLGIFASALRLMPRKNLLNAAAILIVAASTKVIASAMRDISKLDWNEIAKGLVGIAGALGVLVLALKFMSDPKAILGAGALVIASFSLGKLASAMKTMGGMSWADIGAALVVLAGGLTVLAAAIIVLSVPAFLLGAAALVVASFGLRFLADSMKTMGGMSWADIGAALGALAGGLIALAAGLTAMMVSLPGALALLAAGPGLKMLAEVMVKIGAMSWSDIGAAVGGMAAMFAVLAVGGALSPLIGALGLALGVLAGGVYLIGKAIEAGGAGIDRASEGLERLSNLDSKDFDKISNALQVLIDKIPALMKAIAEGLVESAKVIADGAPEFGRAAAAIMAELARVIGRDMPKTTSAVMTGLTNTLGAMAKKMPNFVQKGADIVVNFLTGVAQNMKRVVKAGSDVVFQFLTSMTGQMPRLIDAGTKLLLSVLYGMSGAIRTYAGKFRAAAIEIGDAIIDGIFGGISNGQPALEKKIGGMAKGLLDTAKWVLGIKSPSREFRKVGEFVVLGFAEGLIGSPDKIDEAARKLVDQLNTGMESSTKTMESQAKRIKDLTASRTESMRKLALAQQDLNRARAREVGSTAKTAAARAAEIKREQAAKDAAIRVAQERIRSLQFTINQQTVDIRAAQAAYNVAKAENTKEKAALAVTETEAYKKQKDALADLGEQYEVIDEQLKEANKTLEDATKTRDDYNQSLRDSFGAQEQVGKDTVLTDYISDLETQIIKTQQFSTAVQELRKRGLNDEFYKQLLASGTESMPFVEQLLEGGPAAIDQINYLGSELDKAAGNLADSASTSLYQAAVDSAAGFVKGLQDQEDAIATQMQKIADAMIASIKKALGIRSPSRVFAEVGKYSAQGLAKGLEGSASLIEQSAAKMGDAAVDSMKKTILGLGDLIAADVDMNPVIAPVLDLSNIKRDASQLGSLLGAPISIDGSMVRDASGGFNANQEALAALLAAEGPAPIQFTQINNSPKALSSAEIYRLTNNQISVAKGALTGNARQGRSS